MFNKIQMGLWKYGLIVLVVNCCPFNCSSLERGLSNPSQHYEKLQKLFKLLECCGLQDLQSLRRTYLKGNTTTCNDGSPAGFYFRPSNGSKRWIVFLEGGWYCFDSKSCLNRWSRMRHLMSSKQWPLVRNVGGLLSPNPEENPYWWNANHVFIPYCTSDSWSGRRREPLAESHFTFMGSLIIEEVINELLSLGLDKASSLILAGSSAGGAGVMLNLESVQHQLRDYPSIIIRGISDSGWFLDRAPFSSKKDGMASVETIQKGLVMWEGQIPHSCKRKYVQDSWRCFFGYRLYPYLKAPLFIFQWLFDEAQMTVDNVGAPVTKQQWDYIHKMGDSLRHTFRNVSSVFAPSCISHSVLTKRDWQLLKIDDVTLPQALRCWELSTQADEKELSIIHGMLGDAPSMAKIRNKQPKQHKSRNLTNRGRDRKKKRRRNRNRNRGGRRRKHGCKKNKLRSLRETSMCKQRLIERCSWPQCNHSCPKLHNPFTGFSSDIKPDFAPAYITLSSLYKEPLHSTKLIDREIQIHWVNGTVDRIALYIENPSPLAEPVLQFNTVMYPDCVLQTEIPLGNPPLPGGWERNSEETPVPGEHCLPVWLVAYKSGEIAYTDCLKIRPTWMQDNRLFLESMKITSAFLPGTHNSGSFKRGETLSQNDISGRYIVTQDQSLWNQLVFGIRYLDFRIGYYSLKKNASEDLHENFWINHDLIKVRRLKPLLDDIKSFLKRTRDEILILDLHRFPLGFNGRPGRHTLLVELLEKELKEYALHYTKDSVPTLGTFWDQGKRMIISYGDNTVAQQYDWLWPPIRQLWGNKQTVDSLYQYLETCMRNDSLRDPRRGIWSAMAQLTPGPLDLLLNPKGSLRSMAYDVNMNLTSWCRDAWWDSANVVAVDFFLGTDLISTAVAVNAFKGNTAKQYETYY